LNTKDMLFGIAIFAAGLLTGIFIGSRQTAPAAAPPAMTAPGPMPGGFAPPAPPAEDKIARIAMAEQLVTRDPKNVQAWIGLGNDYYDTAQHQKSIEAYGKALALDPNNADVLTDQGIMLRAVGQFDKAIANFEKAQKINPRHLQSLYNQAVVFEFDLKQSQKAVQILEKVAQLDPNGPQGAQAREAIARIKAAPAGK
jgi:tetratricopeptide (TPR) repeat protein